MSGGFGRYRLVPGAKSLYPAGERERRGGGDPRLLVGSTPLSAPAARPGAGLADTSLVLGDAAIGLFTMQVARLEGGPVGVVGHHEHSLAIARELGADFTLNSHREDVEAAVRERTGGWASTWCMKAWAAPRRP